MNRETIVPYLSKHLRTPICILEGLLDVGGNSQLTVFSRIAACLRLDELVSEGKRPQQAYAIVSKEFGYTSRYVKMLRDRFPHHFSKFTCNEG